jgi:Domain of unknown function (DUF4893)
MRFPLVGQSRLMRLLVRGGLVALLAMLVSGHAANAEEPDWRQVITPTDQDRLDRLAEAIREGDSRAAASDPAPEDLTLLRSILGPADQPVVAEDLVGDWRCRTIKVGDILVAYAPFKCRIRLIGESLFLEKVSGSQRLSGHLYADGGTRLILLGAATVNDEPQRTYSPIAGEADLADPQMDVVGVLSQYAPGRLRILFPWPHFESVYDVMALSR